MSKIKLTYPFIFAIGILVFFDKEYRLFSLIMGAVIHEIGHICGIYLCKVKFDYVEIGLCGAVIHYGEGRLTSYKSDIIISAMGPAFNLITILLCRQLCDYVAMDLTYFLGINTAFMLFNIMPALPLDGGRILHSTLAMFLSIDVADMIMLFVSVTFSVFGMIIGFMAASVNGNSFTLILVSCFMIFGFLSREKQPI